MAKNFSKCKVCGGMRFVNYAGMCKRCNRKKESHNIMEKVLEERMERIESRKKEVIKEAEVKAEEEELAKEESAKLEKEQIKA